MSAKHCGLLTLGIIGLVGCGNDVVPPNPAGPSATPPVTNTEPFVHVAPTLAVASPSEMSVGDSLTVLGDDFIKPLHGKVLVHFVGTFFDDMGQGTPVEHRAEATFLNQAKVEWPLWPNVVFAPTGDRLGRFVGSVSLVNQARDGVEKASDPLPVAIDIKPSLIPRVIQPRGEGCQAIVSRTRENQPMILSVEAVGLRPGTQESPLVVSWTFLKQHWQVQFGSDSMDPSQIVPDAKGSVRIEDRLTQGGTSTLSDGGTASFFIEAFNGAKSDIFGEKRLTKLRTRPIDKAANSVPVSVAVSAVDASGKKATIALKLDVGKVVDMHYDHSEQIAERFAPVLVSDCIPGGDIGRDVNYHETNSSSEHRSTTFSYHANAGLRLGLPSNPWVLGLDLSAGFGVNINESVSSDTSRSLSMQAHILPGQYAAFYRQKSKLLRVAQLVGYSACGDQLPLGEVTLTDWVFAHHLATGDVCVPAPSMLPPAQKFIYDE